MAFTVEQWETIAHFPVCPVQALEEALVDKDRFDLDIPRIDLLIEELRKHEKDLRVLRQEIERRVRLHRMEQYKDEHKSVKN